MNRKQKKLLARIIISAALMIALHFIPCDGYLRLVLYLIPYFIIGWDILKKAALGIVNRQVFDENFLMAVATIGAIIIAVTGEGDYTEAVAVMLFYQTGELFQSCAVGKSRRSISKLMDIRPDYANIEQDGQLVQVDPDEVEVGTVITVGPGEKIPIDGTVIRGRSELNTSALTGESLPRTVMEGDEVFSGCINLSGELHIRTDKPFGQSTASKILDLVENASSRKSRPEAFISRFARIYTPVVCLGALALAIIPPVFCLFILRSAPQWGVWIYRALTFLVISCPCALVISIPLTFFAAIGGAGRAGILVKGSNYLEALSRTDTVVLDKTGTITEGNFEVIGVHHCTMERSKLLYYSAHAESGSSHPIGKSIIRAYGSEPDRSHVDNIRQISGKGVVAEVDGKTVAAGNISLMSEMSVDCSECSLSGTVVHIAIDGQYAGHILIADRVKEHSAEAMASLKKAGVSRIVMLTGDALSAAQPAAEAVGIDEYACSLLPADKVERVEALLSERSSQGTLAFVGDGINDAPVLARADVGIAMGAMGSDAAIEAADVVLMDDDPGKISVSIRLARRCMNIVRQNIVFAIGVKALCLILGAIGIAGMWTAIFADVGVMILAVLNAIRALKVKK